jgi:hypothetical protein
MLNESHRHAQGLNDRVSRDMNLAQVVSGRRRNVRAARCHISAPATAAANATPADVNITRLGMDRPRAAQPFEFPLLQHPKQLRLELERRLANLVEKDRAPAGQLELSDSLGNGAGEGAFLMAEQLAFEETGRDRRTVPLHEGIGSTRAQGVHRASDQLFPCAGLAANQHRRIGRRDHLDLLEHVSQRPAPADDPLADHVIGRGIPKGYDAGLSPLEGAANRRETGRLNRAASANSTTFAVILITPSLAPAHLSVNRHTQLFQTKRWMNAIAFSATSRHP